ncbi:MAG: hypothetical protein AAGG06_17120 [Pseudomonadota bacterium]
MPARWVKPYLRRPENRPAEALKRPHMRLLSIETREQLERQAMHLACDPLVARCTAVRNQIPGPFLEHRGL